MHANTSCPGEGKLPELGNNLLSKLSITSGLKVFCPIWILPRAGFRNL